MTVSNGKTISIIIVEGVKPSQIRLGSNSLNLAENTWLNSKSGRCYCFYGRPNKKVKEFLDFVVLNYGGNAFKNVLDYISHLFVDTALGKKNVK